MKKLWICRLLAFLVVFCGCGTDWVPSSNKTKILCGGFTDQREISKDEMTMFNGVLSAEGREGEFTPLSVATQVVAGLNYKFYCSHDLRPENAAEYCYVTIYKPLQGDPELTKVE